MEPRRPTIDLTAFAAFVFDLDGVVTKTAVVHAWAWRRTFDEALLRIAPTQPPFDDEAYRAYVDGRPRRDGIRAFLAARGIAADEALVERLAARKNEAFVEHLRAQGVAPYADAVQLLQRARAAGVRTAVVSASENCAAVVAAAGLTAAFDARVDGNDVARGLRGKPAPDTFVEAARRLGIAPARCAVFEDARAGVRAGRAGGFGCVVGVDRTGEGEALARDGADVVVTTLDEVVLAAGGAPR